MPMLTILPSGRTMSVAEGATILSALLEAEEKIASKCGAEAKCGACHVYVQTGRKSLSKMERLENERLDSIVGVGSKSRLACQGRFGTEDVTVELLGFGSGF